MKFIFDILLKFMPFPTSSDAFLEVPEDKKYCLCPDCDSLLGMSYFHLTKCGCGFHGKPHKILTENEAIMCHNGTLERGKKSMYDDIYGM
jgi:hypothetical protein